VRSKISLALHEVLERSPSDPSKSNYPRLLRLLCGPSPPHWAIITSLAFVMRSVLASGARES